MLIIWLKSTHCVCSAQLNKDFLMLNIEDQFDIKIKATEVKVHVDNRFKQGHLRSPAKLWPSNEAPSGKHLSGYSFSSTVANLS